MTPNEQQRIIDTIENTDYYDMERGNKYFLVDEFYKTKYLITSFSSLRAKRYFWLDEIEGFKDGMTAEQVANLLNGKTWE